MTSQTSLLLAGASGLFKWSKAQYKPRQKLASQPYYYARNQRKNDEAYSNPRGTWPKIETLGYSEAYTKDFLPVGSPLAALMQASILALRLICTDGSGKVKPREKETGNMKKLTGKQEAFAQAYVLNGGNASQAYRDSYSSSGMAKSTLYNEASRTLAIPEVSHRVEELRLPIREEAIASIEKRKVWLTNLIDDDYARNTDKLRAVDLLNQMEGVYITKVEAKAVQVVELVIVTEEAPIVPVG